MWQLCPGKLFLDRHSWLLAQIKIGSSHSFNLLSFKHLCRTIQFNISPEVCHCFFRDTCKLSLSLHMVMLLGISAILFGHWTHTVTFGFVLIVLTGLSLCWITGVSWCTFCITFYCALKGDRHYTEQKERYNHFPEEFTI